MLLFEKALKPEAQNAQSTPHKIAIFTGRKFIFDDNFQKRLQESLKLSKTSLVIVRFEKEILYLILVS
jgi:hypothetical protein